MPLTPLRVEGVGFSYRGGAWLFRGLTREFHRGRIVAIVGPSGSGKSTLLQILLGSLGTKEGRVERTPGAHVALVHQIPHGLPNRTLLDHVCLPLLFAGCTRSEALTQAVPILESFGLKHLMMSPYRELSGGEAQRLRLTMAVAQKADIIIADEPTAALDAVNAKAVTAVLTQTASRGAAVIIATHDPRVRAVCDEVLDLTTIGAGA